MRVAVSASLLVLLGSAGLTGGCTDDEGAAAPPAQPSGWEPQSGSRLQARYLVSEEGTRVFQGWFDSARGELCRIGRGEGGRYYCFPESNPAAFRDNRCREAVGEHRACARRYTGVSRGDRLCGNQSLTLWEEGAALELASPYRLVNDFCLAPAAAEGPGRYVSLGGRIPESDLVQGRPDGTRPELRLQPRQLRFDDGAVASLELVDSSRSRTCVRTETTSGVRCLPENVLYVGASGPYFADRACTEPVAHAIAPACFMPALALGLDSSSGCPRVARAWKVEPQGRLDPRWVFSGPACESGVIIPGHFYKLGEPVDVTNYPELTVAESGAGRLRLRWFTAAGGQALPPPGQYLFDTVTGSECQVATAGDGVLRCLPLGGPALNVEDAVDVVYADDGCTRPLARYATAQACNGPRATGAMVARVALQRCSDPRVSGGDPQPPERWDIHRLGARHEGDLFVGRPGACQRGAAAPDSAYYQLGEAIDPAEFVPFRAE